MPGHMPRGEEAVENASFGPADAGSPSAVASRARSSAIGRDSLAGRRCCRGGVRQRLRQPARQRVQKRARQRVRKRCRSMVVASCVDSGLRDSPRKQKLQSMMGETEKRYLTRRGDPAKKMQESVSERGVGVERVSPGRVSVTMALDVRAKEGPQGICPGICPGARPMGSLLRIAGLVGGDPRIAPCF